jgi:murein DD-endopeptidase MepM/ murein hydrolase activator NlpD
MNKNDEQQDKKKKKEPMDGEKRFYLLTAIGCAVALTAIITVAVVFTGGNHTATGNLDNINTNQPSLDDGKDDEEVIVTPEGFVMPLQSVSVSNDYGFYYNSSVGAYYTHQVVDFSAVAGTEVYSVDKGVIESIRQDPLLTGTEIIVDHGDGVKSVYRFVDALESLSVGDSVEKGEQIAVVAEACGNEHKDGAHLHLEIIEDGKKVDPNLYLTLEEK